MSSENGRQRPLAGDRSSIRSSKWRGPPSVKDPVFVQARTRASQWLNTRLGVYLERDAVGLMALLRKYRPLLATPRFTMVSRAGDVREVLADTSSYSVAAYRAKMTKVVAGFVLSVDDPEQHASGRRLVETALRPGDAERIAARTAVLAEARVAAAASGLAEIDLVGALASPVLAAAAAEHLGLSTVEPAVFGEWVHDLFHDVFLNPFDDPEVGRRGAAAVAGLRATVGAAVAGERTGGDDVLSRLLDDPSLTMETLTGNVVALAAAWVPNTAKSFALAMAELLDRPAALAGARAAALAGDRERVAGHVMEALRFRPTNSGLVRVCAKDSPLGLAAGTPVLALTKSAMRDERVVDSPEEFRAGRAATDYLHFGHGPHACPGAGVSRAQMAALATPVLRLPGLRPASGRRGRIRWRGPFPDSLRVTFDR